jgi:hypothetical protein
MVGPELFAALGTMADRLAQTLSQRRAQPGPDALTSELEVAESYGVRLISFESDGRTQLCYDGEAFRRLLALGGAPADRAQAALALTRPSCVDPHLPAVERPAVDTWRWSVVERVDPTSVPPMMANRLRLRRAALLAERVYQSSRHDDPKAAALASEQAVKELALVDKGELADEDALWYEETAIRVGAARWAEEPPRRSTSALRVETAPGKPGETCVRLVDTRGKAPKELASRCTYGLVWAQSARSAPHGDALALAVQPLSGWVELWVFRRVGDGWQLDTVPPAAVDPELGYVELCGWSPDGARLLVVTEARTQGTVRREFEVLNTATLTVEKRAHNPEVLASFRSWPSADWKGRTLALR